MPSRVHAYDQYEIESLKGIPIPAKIKCGRCHKNLPHIQYSTKQLTDYRYQVKHNGTRGVTTPIKCTKCTGGSQIVELECTMCHKTRGLEEFAKSQRKPDTARCFRCTTDQLNRQPVSFARYEGENLDQRFLTPDDFKGYVPEYWSSKESTDDTASELEWKSARGETRDDDEGGVSLLAKDFKRGASVSASNQTLIEVDDPYSRASKNGDADGWSDVQCKSWHTKSTGPTSTSANSHTRPSTTSVTGTQRSYASSVAERSDVSDVRPNGWARIPRGSPMLPMGDAQRACDEAWDDEDGSDVEEDDDDDDSDGENTII